VRPRKRTYSPVMIAIGAICTIVAAYYCAAAMHHGETIFQWQERLRKVLEEPFRNYLNAYTLKTVLVFLFAYVLLVLMYVTSRKNYLPGREMGSAKYADVKKVNKKLADLSNDPTDPANVVIPKRSLWLGIRWKIWSWKRRSKVV